MIGFLNAGSSGAYAEFVRAFHVGLGEAGFVEGRNVTVEYRWAEGKYDRLPGFAADLVRARAAVIASAPNPATLVAKEATSTIPIVFISGPDPVRAGLVSSLSRPGGNLTGVTTITSEIAPKRLELMRELVPQAGTFAFLTNFGNERAKPDVAEMQAAAGKLGQKLVAAGPTNIAEIEAAFGRLAKEGVGAVIVSADPFFNSVRPQFAAIAARHGIPAMFAEGAYVRDGGLLSYGASLTDTYRQVGVYVGRILKGEKPAELPVQRPVKFELVVNLKTAKALRLTIPESFLTARRRGDRVRRRAFITLLGGAAATWPLSVRAQPGERMRRVGVLMSRLDTDAETKARIATFRETLGRLGWAEGRNTRIDFRFAASNLEQLRSHAAELLGLKPDVLWRTARRHLKAFANATRTVPIVFVGVSDAVSAGFVPSLAKPGGNITGFSNFEYSIGGKWLELLKEAAPGMARVGVLLFRDDSAWSRYLAPVEAVAPSLGVQVTRIFLGDAKEIERDIDAFAREPHGGLLVTNSSRAGVHRNLIVDLAIRHRLPAIFSNRIFAVNGGLMSYGIDTVDMFRGGAVYVDRILRGEKAGNLPVQLPTKYEFVVNMRTARAMGFAFPPALPLRADEVIE